MSKSRYIAVDIVKIIFAYIIVLQHVLLFNKSNTLIADIVGTTVKIAVPYFFVASGYFLYKNIMNNPQMKKSITYNYIKKISILYLCWTAILFVFRIPAIIRMGTNIEQQSKYWINYIRSALFSGEYQLWYLLALIQIVVLFVIIRHDVKACLIISAITYVITLVVTYKFEIIESNNVLMTIYNIYASMFVDVNNSFLGSFIFFAIGCYIAKLNRDYNKIILIILTIIVTGIVILSNIYKASIIFTISKIVMVTMLFCTTIAIGKKNYSNVLRDMSSFVYVSHMAILLALEQMFGEKSTMVEWLLSCIIATVSGCVLFKLRNKIKVTKNLY